jgi:hypothetical protein
VLASAARTRDTPCPTRHHQRQREPRISGDDVAGDTIDARGSRGFISTKGRGCMLAALPLQPTIHPTPR